MRLFERPEPILLVGLALIAAHMLGWREGRSGLAGLGAGLFMVLKGCQELVAPRHPRLATAFLAASAASLLLAAADGLLGWR